MTEALSGSARAEVRIRLAVPADSVGLRALIEASVRELQVEDYTSFQREQALQRVYGVDSQLVADGTFFVAEAAAAHQDVPLVAGCGGWSRRKTLFGGDNWNAREDALLDPTRDAARIRAFFVHPRWARRGVGTALLDACESAARGAGFARCEMGATLTGARLFGARGYVEIERIEVTLDGGLTLPVIRMEKAL